MRSFFDAVIKRDNTNSVKWNPTLYKARFNDHEDLLPLWVADMDFRISSGITQRLQNVVNHGILGYTCRDEEYYEAIKRWNKILHDWEIEKEDIFFTPGVVPAINYVISAFTEPEESILIQTPVYYPFQRSIQNHGRTVIKNPLVEVERGKYEIDFEDMEKKILENNVRLFILCNPHNPVGRVWTREELEKMAEICLKHDVLVLADEIHSDLIFENKKHIPFHLLSPQASDNSIVCTSVSKTFNLAGLRVSNIIIKNPEYRAKFKKVQEELAIEEPNTFAIEAVKGAYLESDEWYKEMLGYIEENINYVEEYLKEKLPKVKFVKPEGTYLIWLDFRDYNLSYEEMQRVFEEEVKVAIDYGDWFGEEGTGFIRMNVACPRSILKEGLDKIATKF